MNIVKFLYNENGWTDSFFFSKRGGIIGMGLGVTAGIFVAIDSLVSKRSPKETDAKVMTQTLITCTAAGAIGGLIGTFWKISIPVSAVVTAFLFLDNRINLNDD